MMEKNTERPEKKLIEMKRDPYLGRATIFTSFDGGSA